ncbi:hypothetical protein ASE13_08020 [Sphingomonas sp. Root241]|nr:hypothetical protein ASE13_08020 [Sphingomonas sp. Root241]
MLFDCADTDAEFSGYRPLRFSVDPKATEDHSRSFRQAIQDSLENLQLLPCDEFGLDRRLVVRLSAGAMRARPILLAALTPAGGTPMQQEMVVGHFIKIGARLRYGSRPFGQQFDVHVLKHVLRLVRRRTTALEEARQRGTQFRKQGNEAAAIQHFMRTFGFRQR